MGRLPGLEKHSVDIIILLTRLTRAALSAKGSPDLREARLLVTRCDLAAETDVATRER